MSNFPGSNGGIFDFQSKLASQQTILDQIQQQGTVTSQFGQFVLTTSDLPTEGVTLGTLIYVKETTSFWELRNDGWVDSELNIKDLIDLKNAEVNLRLQALEDKLAGFQLVTLDEDTQCYYKEGDII